MRGAMALGGSKHAVSSIDPCSIQRCRRYSTSDVQITARNIRRAALSHAILSFAYNTVILALTLNLLFGAFA